MNDLLDYSFLREGPGSPALWHLHKCSTKLEAEWGLHKGLLNDRWLGINGIGQSGRGRDRRGHLGYLGWPGQMAVLSSDIWEKEEGGRRCNESPLGRVV